MARASPRGEAFVEVGGVLGSRATGDPGSLQAAGATLM